MRNFLFGLLFYLVALPSHAQEARSDLTNVFQSTIKATAKLLVKDENGAQIASGSGFFVRLPEDTAVAKLFDHDSELTDLLLEKFAVGSTKGHAALVTNFHVVRGASSVDIVLPDKSRGQVAKVLSEDRSADLCILHVEFVDAKAPPSLQISPVEPEVGEDVFCIGSPLGLDFSFSNGIVNGLRKSSRGISQVQISNPISPGSSGGPLVTDDGKVVGIITSSLTAGQNLNFAVSAQTLHRLFLDVSSKRLVSDRSSIKGDVESEARSLQTALIELAVENKDNENVFKGLKSIIDPLMAKRFDEVANAFVKSPDPFPEGFDHLRMFFQARLQANQCFEIMAEPYDSSELRAKAVRESADYKFGVDLLTQSINLKPDFLPSYNLLLILHDYAMIGESALPVANQFIEKQPDNYNAYLHRGAIYNRMGEHELALKDMNEAKSLHPRQFVVLLELGRTLGLLSRYDQAANAFLQASELKVSQPVKDIAISKAASVLHIDGQFARAIALYRRIKDPDANVRALIEQCDRAQRN